MQPCYMPLLGGETQVPSGDPVVGGGGKGEELLRRLSPHSLVSPSFTCLEPPHLANLTLETASECLTQH